MYLNAKSALVALNSKINNQPAKFQSDDDDDDDDDLPELVPYSSQVPYWCYAIERRQPECVLNDRRHKPRALALETEFKLQLGPAWRLLYARQVPILLASYYQFLFLFEKAHPIYVDQWSRMYQWIYVDSVANSRYSLPTQFLLLFEKAHPMYADQWSMILLQVDICFLPLIIISPMRLCTIGPAICMLLRGG